MFPTLPNGHLYQWATTAGSLLCIASIVGFAAQFNSQNTIIRDNIDRIIDAQKTSPELQEFWRHYLATERSNMTWFAGFLAVAAIIGLIFAITGGWCWYNKVQWYEDELRRFNYDEQSQGPQNGAEKPDPSTDQTNVSKVEIKLKPNLQRSRKKRRQR